MEAKSAKPSLGNSRLNLKSSSSLAMQVPLLLRVSASDLAPVAVAATATEATPSPAQRVQAGRRVVETCCPGFSGI